MEGLGGEVMRLAGGRWFLEATWGKGKFQSEAGERPRPVRAINGEEEARWALCAVSTRMHYHKWEKVSGVCCQPELLVKGEVLKLDAELEGYWEIDVGI